MKKNILRVLGVVTSLVVIAALIAATGSPAHAAQLHAHVLSPDSLLFAGITGSGVTYGTVSDLNKAFRRGTTKLYRTYTRRVAEYKMADNIPDEEITPSGRETLIPLDVSVGVGAHQASLQ